MNHRERALAAIKHEIPDRTPISWIGIEDPVPVLDAIGLDSNSGLEALNDHFGTDIKMVSARVQGKSLFGNSGSQLPYGIDAHKRPFGSARTVEEIDRYLWPGVCSIDFDSLFTSSGLSMDSVSKKYAVVLGNWTSVFCEVCDFFGMEKALFTLYENPILIEAAVSHIEEAYMEYCNRLFASAAGRADIFHMWDDISSQRGMIMSPAMWRKYFKPTTGKMFECAKRHGLYVWFHSCGIIVDVIPDLIEMGMDVWETVQAHLPGNEPERLKKEFGRYITFDGGISTQSTLPFGTLEDVRAEVRDRIRTLGKGGGYICNSDHVIKKDTPPENTVALFDEILRFRCAGCTDG